MFQPTSQSRRVTTVYCVFARYCVVLPISWWTLRVFFHCFVPVWQKNRISKGCFQAYSQFHSSNSGVTLILGIVWAIVNGLSVHGKLRIFSQISSYANWNDSYRADFNYLHKGYYFLLQSPYVSSQVTICICCHLNQTCKIGRSNHCIQW